MGRRRRRRTGRRRRRRRTGRRRRRRGWSVCWRNAATEESWRRWRRRERARQSITKYTKPSVFSC